MLQFSTLCRSHIMRREHVLSQQHRKTVDTIIAWQCAVCGVLCCRFVHARRSHILFASVPKKLKKRNTSEVLVPAIPCERECWVRWAISTIRHFERERGRHFLLCSTLIRLLDECFRFCAESQWKMTKHIDEVAMRFWRSCIHLIASKDVIHWISWKMKRTT